jgi:hypothetical protein
LKEFLVEVEAFTPGQPGGFLTKKSIKAGTPRVAVDHALKKTRSFGLKYNGGNDRQLSKGETLIVTVRNMADVPEEYRAKGGR